MNVPIISETPMPFQLPPPDPREQAIEEQPRSKVHEIRPAIRSPRVISAADVKREIEREAEVQALLAFDRVYALVQTYGCRAVQEWALRAADIQQQESL